MLTQTNSTAVAYRRMNEDDISAAHALSQAVRWPHRTEDWQFVLRVGTGYVAEQEGTVIGTGLCWKQGDGHASLGMIIVSPDHQGKGIGRELMRLVLEELGDRCVLLNATAAGQPLYERMGFAAIGTLYQHQGILAAIPSVALDGGARVRPAAPEDLPAIIALADRATGMARDTLVRELAAMGEVAVLERNGAPVGFAILRQFGRGRVIGPLVAPDTDSAKALIAQWSGAYAGTFVRIDIDGAGGLGPWLEQAGLARVDTAVIMARNGVPRRDGSVTQFAIINQALC
ncbi:GNAT family N-acetyltransferase [Telluria mixta]|uniref:GNAT family N-acetyltransferase n=1 Tax=Telluria mixta TaxID=34071 RepID=A0ABT2C526_9BURK|nr:GNAT family N-acetyltransferase [Telluria mixta]MCS0632501.1 GNAT family N-acetyltransferase [Telluria mixta]WEM99202.1 GNAT family N-acetyltransferase [Telluria mixta]